MTFTDLQSYLSSQKQKLDTVISEAAEKFIADKSTSLNFKYDLQKCQEESFNLIRGQDLCYDRPNTALVYSLWYHPRRINTFLSHFAKKLCDLGRANSSLTIFDLGAGTGAVQWAVGLVASYFFENGYQLPPIRIVNIDSSPVMLKFNQEFLWPTFLLQYPHCANIYIEYNVNSWNNASEVEITNNWLCASYLFDISDNQDLVREDFLALTKTFNPSNILLLSSNQQKKVALLESIKGILQSRKYSVSDTQKVVPVYSGETTAINRIREHLYSITGVPTLARRTRWDDSSFYGLVFEKIDATFSFEPITVKKVDIYNPPFRVRRDIVLNDEQKAASVFSTRPTIIVGPAGCGKSVVMTEKIINTLKAENFRDDIQILVTTFNKDLLNKLGDWLEDLLNKENVFFNRVKDLNYYGYIDGSGYFTFNGAKKVNIRLVHFDMLPKKIGHVQYRFCRESAHHQLLSQIIPEVCTSNNVPLDSYPAILNSEFLLEEYHRVIYGLQCKISDGEEAYQNVKRAGRGKRLDSGIQRKLVWDCLSRYARHIFNHNELQTFTTRRQLLLYNLRNNQVDAKFDYVFVDEFQDCTLADFEIFGKLVKDVNNITIAGDIAQAIHIGKSARIPKNEGMSRREFHRLRGSYRLPVRISECIVEISRKIKESHVNKTGVEEISPYKGSPPGARPIVVYGSSPSGLAQKIAAVYSTYKFFDIEKVTILEKNSELARELSELKVPTETDTILKLKGLEKECIVWSSSTEIEFEKEIKEFVYTILTRTSCLLIIAIDANTPELIKPILSLLRKDRLIYWDEESETVFQSHCQPYTDTSVDEEAEVSLDDLLEQLDF